MPVESNTSEVKVLLSTGGVAQRFPCLLLLTVLANDRALENYKTFAPPLAPT